MKKKNSYLVMVLVALCILGGTKASHATTGRDSVPETSYTYGYPYPFALGIHAGTSGVGLHLYKPLGQHFGLRLAGSYMPLNATVSGNYDNRDVNSTLTANSSNVSLAFGWTPFATKSGFFRSFNIQVGGGYFFQLEGNLETRLKDPYKWGDISVTPEMVGTIQTDINWKETVNPYAGIGWSNIVIDSRFSMNIDLGAYYLSKPTVSMKASGLLEENISNAKTIERNIETYRYLPPVEIGFSYRFW
jgi:hypothetical protein